MRTSDRETAAAERGSSKALAGRVSTPAGLDPHPITRYVWRTSLVASLVTVLLAGAYIGFGGDKRAFQTRRVSSPHGFVEHDCAKCHDTWAPAERIAATFTGGTVHSVTNEKCESCHLGALHHANQLPGHEPTATTSEYLSCAKCHREHRGNVDLTYIASRHCTECHERLDDHVSPKPTGPDDAPPYALAISDFEAGGGHPEFALIRALAGEVVAGRSDTVVTPVPTPKSLAPFVRREGQPAGDRAWHDPGRIRFNHYAHLRRPVPVKDDTENANRWGERMQCYEIGADSAKPVPCNENTAPMVALRCSDCHVPDADGRYMLSIDYTQHCRVCHEVPFDTDRFPDLTVPHAAIAEASRERRAAGMEVLRGFLAEKYAAEIVRRRTPEEIRKIDPLLLVPGRPTRALLTTTEREQVRTDADAANDALLRTLTDEDILILRATVNTIGESATGGCRFCHDVATTSRQLEVVQGKYWIRPPGIPDRWMPHSRFDHASHRDMTCGQCHRNEQLLENPDWLGLELPRVDPKGGPTKQDDPSDLMWSSDTGDVLMPSIAVCRTCHSPRPTHPDVGSARSDCVECHRYHDHSSDPFDTGLGTSFGPMDEGGS